MHPMTKPWAYYNEFDEYAADWLENLIARGLIAPGVVDRRSIIDVRPDDLRGFRQCHFFAGIGVWSYGLRRAGVSDDTPLWTGSPPCQPFSAAGQRGGVDDERHLWPALFHLIGERRPERFFGEQVASKDGLGWLDLVLTDMENAGYAIWAVDTCSAGSGAPHIRQRLRICAYDLRSTAGGLQHASGDGRQQQRAEPGGWGAASGRVIDGMASSHNDERRADLAFGEPEGRTSDGRGGPTLRLDYSLSAGLEGLGDGHRPSTGQWERPLRPVASPSGVEWVADEHGDGRGEAGERGASAGDDGLVGDGSIGGMAEYESLSRRAGLRDLGATGHRGAVLGHRGAVRHQPNRPSPTNGFWGDADWLFCRDGSWRPVEPGTFPLVDGAAFRMGSGGTFEGKSRKDMLKGYGNAVDAEATTDFIVACIEATQPARDPAEPLVVDLSADEFAELL